MRAGLAGLVAFVLAWTVAADSNAQMIVGGGEVVGSEWVTIDATVEEIDVEARVLTVLDPQGELVMVTVDPAVDLTKIKEKEEVTIKYREQAVLEIRKYAGPPKTPEHRLEDIETADMGLDAPTAAAQSTIQLTPNGAEGYETQELSVTIEDVNRAKGVITLAGEGGKTHKIDFGPEVDLRGLEPGDRVVLLVTEAVAVNVTPK
jgi:hypothetical protein